MTTFRQQMRSSFAPLREICFPESRGPLVLGCSLLASPPPSPPFFGKTNPTSPLESTKRCKNEPKTNPNEPNKAHYVRHGTSSWPCCQNGARLGANSVAEMGACKMRGPRACPRQRCRALRRPENLTNEPSMLLKTNVMIFKAAREPGILLKINDVKASNPAC